MPLDATTVLHLAELVDLPLPESCRESVAVNVDRFAAAAKLVMEFPLPPEIESAATFTNEGTTRLTGDADGSTGGGA